MQQATLLKKHNMALRIGAVGILLASELSLSSAVASQESFPDVKIERDRTLSTHVRQGFPGRRISDGNRCGCPYLTVVALVPPSNLGQAIKEQPTLYFALPATPSSQGLTAHSAEFTLATAERSIIHRATFQVDADSDTISYQMPANLLETETIYSWALTVVSTNDNHTSTDSVEGQIRRVLPNPERGITAIASENTSLETQLLLLEEYQQAELWLDAIAPLVALREVYPESPEVPEAWEQLIQNLGLSSYLRTMSIEEQS